MARHPSSPVQTLEQTLVTRPPLRRATRLRLCAHPPPFSPALPGNLLAPKRQTSPPQSQSSISVCVLSQQSNLRHITLRQFCLILTPKKLVCVAFVPCRQSRMSPLFLQARYPRPRRFQRFPSCRGGSTGPSCNVGLTRPPFAVVTSEGSGPPPTRIVSWMT